MKKSFWGILTLAFLAAYLVMAMYFMPRATERMNAAAQDTTIAPEFQGPLDLRMSYDTAAVRNTMTWLGEEGRVAYSNIEAQEDIVYPVIYSVFFALVLAFYGRRIFPKLPQLWYVSVLPLIAFVFDMMENYHIQKIIAAYPDLDAGFIERASMFTTLKWGFGLLSMFLIVVFVAVYLVKRFVFRKLKK